MGVKHPHCDVGAESDQFREAISQSETVITSDKHDDQTDTTTIEYIVGEGDPPFGEYRLTLEAIGIHTAEDYATIKQLAVGESNAAE